MPEKIGWWIYYFFQAVRYTILRSGTGVVTHCKHRPSCGKFVVESVRKYGIIKGLSLSIPRILSCW